MASASQSYSSPFDVGIHLAPNLTSRVGESGPPFPLPSVAPSGSQRSRSETLDMKHFPMPPTQPKFGGDMHAKPSAPAHGLAPPVMDWGLPEFDSGRAAAIDQGLAGSPPHLQDAFSR